MSTGTAQKPAVVCVNAGNKKCYLQAIFSESDVTRTATSEAELEQATAADAQV